MEVDQSTGASSATTTATFHAAFDQQAAATPDTIAVVARGPRQRHALTYAAVAARSGILAAGLRAYLGDARSGAGAVLAVELARVHADFVPLLLAASRLGLPFVLLSTDLPDKGLERERNALILRLLQPLLCVSASPADRAASVAYASVEDLDRAGCAATKGTSLVPHVYPAVLCFMFTGGTFRTKVVEVTHAMVLHERVAYADLWQPQTSPAVIMAHTSAYWGASALGQMSIAFAFGGTTVWTEDAEAMDLRRCIEEERVTILGVVPDHLDLLAPNDPAMELPSIEVVFTWGERLPRRLAERWRKHPVAVLRELLIATEYWLSLWTDPLSSSSLQVVRGTELLVLKDDGSDAAVGELGELCIAGPMVMAGYRKGVEALPDVFHVDKRGRRFFMTRDLVRRTAEGVVYKGRADMMAKVKGKWVDMLDVEDQLSQLPGVRAAKILPDPAQEHYHAFVALDVSTPQPSLDAVRKVLPPAGQLWQVPELPRHPVTRKVDAARLLRLVTGHAPKWPAASTLDVPDYLRHRFAKTWHTQLAWTAAAAALTWALADRRYLLQQAGLGVVIWSGASVILRHSYDAEGKVLVFAILWLLVSVLFPLPDFARLLRGGESLFVLTYSWHALIYADDKRKTSWVARAIMRVIDTLPFWKVGAVVSLMLAQHLPGRLGLVSRVMLLSVAGVGALIAVKRRRFFSWPIVFWTLGGQQLDRDCRTWLALTTLRYCVQTPLAALASLASGTCRRMFEFCRRQPALEYAAPCAERPPAADAEVSCGRCGVKSGGSRWPAKDAAGQGLCEACGIAFVVEHEAAAAAWLVSHYAERLGECGGSSPREPVAKRHRVDENGVESQKTEDVCCKPDAIGLERPALIEGYSSEEEKRRYLEAIWYYNHTEDSFDFTPEELRRRGVTVASQADDNVDAKNADLAPEVRLLCAMVGEIEPLLKPVHPATVLFGMDSLRIARLSNSIRAQLARTLSATQIRKATTVAELAELIAVAEEATAELAMGGAEGEDIGKEYAVWYSPGQYTPMGCWCMRTELPLNHSAMTRATQQLTDRHCALRAAAADPLRYISFLYDCATLFTLYGPLLEDGGMTLRCLRRWISWALTKSWPKTRVSSREEIYGARLPGTAAPLELLQITDGQTKFERELRDHRSRLVPPGQVTCYEMICHLCDVWVYHNWNGRFVILRPPAELAGSDTEAELMYVDLIAGECGPLLSPASPRWRTPPYGFPALFFVPLSSGAVVWIRLEKADELRICYKAALSRESELHHLAVFRGAPQRGRAAHEPIVVTYLGVVMLHAFADGNCYLPLVHDLLNLYEAANKGHELRLPPLPCAFAELEKRLFDTFLLRPSPLRSSLRGSLYRYEGKGYGHTIGLEPGAMAAIERAALDNRMPLDVVLFGFVVIAMARADKVEKVDFTLYAPMRDGAAEASMCGLFSDWRDVDFSVDFQLATTLGTLLQVYHKLMNRQWQPFNALYKPEACVVNIMPLDFQHRAGFVHLGENMWRDGDQIGRKEQRKPEMDWAQQPANFVIEQQDEGTWWILCSAGHDHRPTSWMRSFVFAFEETLHSFLFDPLAPVHRHMPDDYTLLCEFEKCEELAKKK